MAADREHGFTLIELLLVVVIMGALAALAIPNFQAVAERARVAKAIGDITAIGQSITEYHLENASYPASLADVGWAGLLDPWGRAYQYQVIQGTPIGALRKDMFLVPINSDFDLYSLGADGASQASLAPPVSHDDVIRANDGGFVGLASSY